MAAFVVVPVLAPKMLTPPTLAWVTRTELCWPVALPPTLIVPVKPETDEGFRNKTPAPDFSMLPEPERVPVRLKLPTPAVLTPPKLTKVVAAVPWLTMVPDSVSVPSTLLMRLLRKVAGESGLTAEVKMPDNSLFPKLKIAEERSPRGPRPSKLMLRASVNPAVLPSSTSEPPPYP